MSGQGRDLRFHSLYVQRYINFLLVRDMISTPPGRLKALKAPNLAL